MSEYDKNLDCTNEAKNLNNSNKPLIIAFAIVILLILADIFAFIIMGYQIHNIEKKNIRQKSQRIQALREKEIQSNLAPDLASYMRDMQRSIKLNWDTPKLDKSTSVTLKYKVNKNGELLEYSVSQSSGIKEMDDSAIKALKETAPFKPLPASYKEENIEVQFTFDYNVFKGK